MNRSLQKILAIVIAFLLVALVIAWIVINIQAGFFPNPTVCRLVGWNGAAHVPANCLKYFIK